MKRMNAEGNKMVIARGLKMVMNASREEIREEEEEERHERTEKK